MWWYVYVLQSHRDNQFYTGITNNLEKRIIAHNKGRVFSTKLRKPFTLVYTEAHRNKSDAAARERFLKTGWGRNWVKKTLQKYLESQKLGG